MSSDTARDKGLVEQDIQHAGLGQAGRWVIDYRAMIPALASPDHGPRHWHDVARIGYALWLMEGAENRAYLPVIFMFAALHDSQRVNEYDDPEHGARAADVMLDMSNAKVIDLTTDQISDLEIALTDHDKGLTHRGGVIDICWDADRLTMERVGKQVDSQYLSTSTTASDLNEALRVARKIMYGPDMNWQRIGAIYEGGGKGDLA